MWFFHSDNFCLLHQEHSRTQITLFTMDVMLAMMWRFSYSTELHWSHELHINIHIPLKFRDNFKFLLEQPTLDDFQCDQSSHLLEKSFRTTTLYFSDFKPRRFPMDWNDCGSRAGAIPRLWRVGSLFSHQVSSACQQWKVNMRRLNHGIASCFSPILASSSRFRLGFNCLHSIIIIITRRRAREEEDITKSWEKRGWMWICWFSSLISKS